MINWGTVPAGAVLPFPFASYGKTNGESITLSGLAVTDVEIYKGTSMTQRASDAGVVLLDTDGIDIDGVTGIHGFSIDTGDNTDAGFYAVGSFFYVIVSAVTIDSQTVNFVAGTFRLAAAEAIAGKPKADVDAWLGTAAATPTVAGVPEVDVTHVAGSTTDVSTIPASVAAILVDTGTTLDGKIDAIDNFIDTEVAAILAAVDTEVAAIKAITDQMAFGTANRLNVQVYGVETDAIGAADISAAAANKIADHVLRRSLATALASSDGDTKGFRSLAGATAKLVNKVTVVGTDLVIKETDDATTLGTQAIATDAAAEPIVGLDTA